MEKIAVIDLGTSSVRLVIANIMPSVEEIAHFVVLDELKEPIVLAQDLDRDGFLKPPRIAGAVKTLQMFKKMCDAHKVEAIYPFTTSSVRKAKNLKSFLEEIQSVCGFKFRVLGEEEEATYIYQGVVNSLDIPKGIIMDISGSTCQFIHYNRRNILHRVNLPFGTHTLNQIFDEGMPLTEQSAMMQAYVLDQFSAVDWLNEIDSETQLIGVGGSFRNIAKIARKLNRYPLNMTHNYNVDMPTFDAIYDSVKTLEPNQVGKIRGLSSQRSDAFLAALTCIKAFLEKSKITKLAISGCGIREGVMFSHTLPITQERPLMDVAWHSVYTMMHYFDVNIKHAEHVCNLSVQLYKNLRVLHKLPRQYVKVLRMAALLHDAGMRIKYYDHAAHSFYFILNANLNGFTHREVVLGAFVAHGHRQGSEFDKNLWAKYKDVVKEEDLMAVLKLSIILRIAESLDRTMSGCVKSISCDVLGESAIMKTEAEGDCSLEIKDALGAVADFARIYRKNLEIL